MAVLETVKKVVGAARAATSQLRLPSKEDFVHGAKHLVESSTVATSAKVVLGAKAEMLSQFRRGASGAAGVGGGAAEDFSSLKMPSLGGRGSDSSVES